MPLKPRTYAWSAVLVLAAGCGTQEPSPVVPVTPAKNPTTAPVPESDLKGVGQDIQAIEKAVTPPVIIGPGTPLTPAAVPGKSG